ncbi:hypothetical protein C1646_783915 [Rhizophagus diaphanus]|nr:hypothetical protein C1646_783915 [Rhizophagus diaphanus] [Rhizophagus sp. MUCL 43196]
MTQDIFRHWIKILDNKLRIQKWQVLMLLNNASSHIEPRKIKKIINLQILLLNIFHLILLYICKQRIRV